MLIEELKAALPGIIIMILEPFILEEEIVEEQWRTTKCRDLVRNEAQKRDRMESRNILPAFIPMDPNVIIATSPFLL